MTPFSAIIDKIQAKSVTKGPLDPVLLLCYTQLSLLDIAYTTLSRYDSRALVENMKSDEASIKEYLYNSLKSNLDFFTFINVLNQFGRALNRVSAGSFEIPKFNRIRFYRNKVLEHWEEYSDSSHVTGQMQKDGQIAVPIIATAFKVDDRRKIKQNIDSHLAAYGQSLAVDETISNVMSLPGSDEQFYKVMEAIDPQLRQNKIPDDIITEFFKYGFPHPIGNVNDYCEELVDYLESHIGI